MDINWKDILTPAAQKMRSSPTFAVAKKASEIRDAMGENHDVIDLTLGEPAEPTRKGIVEEIIHALTESLDNAKAKTWAWLFRYSAVGGIPDLRKGILRKFKEENGIEYRDDKEVKEITVTNGGKQAIYNALAVTIKHGDEMLMAEPSWVSYPDMVEQLGGKAVGLKTNKEFKFTKDTLIRNLEEHPKATWLLINSPSNPTGAVYSMDELREIADVVLAENEKRAVENARRATEVPPGKPVQPLLVLSDNIYDNMVYDQAFMTDKGVAPNIINADPRMKQFTLTVDGMAKSESMTGWRIGFAAGPAVLIKAMETYQSLTSSNASVISQFAAARALSGEKAHKEERAKHLATQRGLYKGRREALRQALKDIPGIEWKTPPGAFYAWVDASGLMGATTPDGKTINTDTDLMEYLLQTKHVATIPGGAFYTKPPTDERGTPQMFIRLCFAADKEKLVEAGKRIKDAVDKLRIPEMGRAREA